MTFLLIAVVLLLRVATTPARRLRKRRVRLILSMVSIWANLGPREHGLERARELGHCAPKDMRNCRMVSWTYTTRRGESSAVVAMAAQLRSTTT